MFARLIIEYRLFQLSKSGFNQNLSLPLISAPVTGSEINMGGYLSEADYCKAVVSGSKMAGTFAMIGDSGNPQFYIDGLNAITEENGCCIAIIKPRENNKIKTIFFMASS